jgi:hypothetical protein
VLERRYGTGEEGGERGGERCIGEDGCGERMELLEEKKEERMEMLEEINEE